MASIKICENKKKKILELEWVSWQLTRVKTVGIYRHANRSNALVQYFETWPSQAEIYKTVSTTL